MTIIRQGPGGAGEYAHAMPRSWIIMQIIIVVLVLISMIIAGIKLWA